MEGQGAAMSLMSFWEAMLSICAIGAHTIWWIEWFKARKIHTWSDLISWRRRWRNMCRALERGAVPCHCNTGRIFLHIRTKKGTLLHITTGDCPSCFGVGAVMPQVPLNGGLR